MKIFSLALVILFAMSSIVASAHGLHAEVSEGLQHLRIHLIENGISIAVSLLIIGVGYAMYRKGRASDQSREKE